MKKACGVLLLFFIQFSLYSDLKQLYSDRLDKNLLYKQTLLKLEQAELDLKHYDNNFVPYLTTGTSPIPGSMWDHHAGLTNGELDPFTINTELVFDKIYGSTIGLSLPYKWDTVSGSRFGIPVLVVSRKLFAESETGYLRVKAAVLENEYKIGEIKLSTGIELTRDIFSAYYTMKSEKLYMEYAAVLETMFRNLKNEKEQNAMKRRLYSMQKLYLKARYERDISGLKEYIESGEVDTIYTEMMETAGGWEQKAIQIDSLPAQEGETGNSKDITALELYLEAAKKEASFWFLPFLPNPTLYASLAYDIEINQVYIGLGFSVTIPLVDHGERDLESRKRKQGEELARRALDDKNEEHEREIKTIRQELNIMKIDMDILGLDRDQAHDDFLEAEQLYAKEMINESIYTLKKLDYELSELALAGKKGGYYAKLLDLLSEYYADTGELFQ